jgi:hypothetical protein
MTDSIIGTATSSDALVGGAVISDAEPITNYYRKPVTITGSTGGAQTDYPVEIDITYDPKMSVDFSDIRFKSSTGTALSFWLQEKVNSTSAKYFVKVPIIPANPDTVTIYMYYGKASYTDASDGDDTFSLYDNFDEVLDLQATNSATVAIDATNYYAENIVYDDVSAKYWWATWDQPTGKIALAYCDDITAPVWTMEADLFTGDAPSIHKFGATWYIYYSTAAGILVQSSATVNSGYSLVGTMLAKGGAGTWDENRLLEPYVILVGSTYYIFYMGETAGTLIEKVGYATSASPTGPFVKYAGNPVLSGDTGWWDTGQDKAADPFVFEKDGTYYIGVTGCTTGKAGWQIGFYTTTDFITFTPYENNPVLNHGWAYDSVNVLRGAVSLFGGVYYFPYAGTSASTKPHLTTLNFDIAGINGRKWPTNVLSVEAAGVVTLDSTSDTLSSNSLFGQNYAIRAKAKFHATGTGIIAFRNSTNTDNVEFIANFPNANDITAYSKIAGASESSADLANPNVWATYECIRNDNTSSIYYIDGVLKSTLIVKIPTIDLPALLYQSVICDWVLVRKYINPEPSDSVGAEEGTGSY